MKQIGIVVEKKDDLAIVSVKRSSSCGDNCSSCSGSCNISTSKVEANNKINADIGDWVSLELKDSTILFAAFVVYIFPIIALFLGYAFGNVIFNNELVSFLIGGALFVLVFYLLKKNDKKLKKSKKYIPEIIEKIKNDICNND